MERQTPLSSNKSQEIIVFISYAREDAEAAKRLYEDLKNAGLTPWLDKESLLAGQNWNIETNKAIKKSKYFIPILSSSSVEKTGYIQRELKYALDRVDKLPKSKIFVIPVRLDDCEMPYEKLKDIEYVDLFPDWDKGVNRIIEAMSMEIKQKKEVQDQFEFAIEEGDIISFNSDVIALKYAQRFYGADFEVSKILVEEGIDLDSLRPLPSKYSYVEGIGSIKAHYVLFIGVLPEGEFKYKQIREFSTQVINIVSKELPNVEHIAMTIHGTGFGLDEVESFLAQFAGIQEGMLNNRSSTSIKRISIVDINGYTGRIKRLRQILPSKFSSAYIRQLKSDGSLYQISIGSRFRQVISGDTTKWINTMSGTSDSIDSAGSGSESKPHVFVAMPFLKEMEDVFYFGIQDPTHDAGFLCERIDNQAFIGDILDQVKKKIESAAVVIADLTNSNPNVYLEVGYAWGKGRPTILVIKAGEETKFDVRGYRHLKYETIKALKEKLDNELKQLKSKGEI